MESLDNTEFENRPESKIMHRIAYFFVIAFTLLLTQQAYSQLPSEGVIFDDFKYTTSTWCSEINDTCTGDHPPAGSVFGENAWDTPSGVQNQRAWYQYLWQEQSNVDAGTSINFNTVTSNNNGHMTFSAAGQFDGHEYENPPTIPQQVISGFTATRGTWAARVNFGDLESQNVADLVQCRATP